MKSRQLGGVGPQVSAIGLGCHAMVGAYGPADDAESFNLLVEAIESGVNLLDTSDAYGAGRSEELIGRVLWGRREKANVITKFGNPGRDAAGNALGICGRPDYVATACDRSLKRLGVETIDIYMLHRVDPNVPIEETVGAMSELVRAGKVRFLGLSEARSETIRRAHATYPLAALESEYSVWSRDIEEDVLPTIRELGIGLIAYSPVGRGFLAGAVTAQTVFGPRDSRAQMPRFAPENLATNLVALEKFKALAASLGATPSQLALAWLLAQSQEIVPIVGTRRTAHLRENAAAADLVLSPNQLRKIEEVLPTDAISGKRYSQDYLKLISR